MRKSLCETMLWGYCLLRYMNHSFIGKTWPEGSALGNKCLKDHQSEELEPC